MTDVMRTPGWSLRRLDNRCWDEISRVLASLEIRDIEPVCTPSQENTPGAPRDALDGRVILARGLPTNLVHLLRQVSVRAGAALGAAPDPLGTSLRTVDSEMPLSGQDVVIVGSSAALARIVDALNLEGNQELELARDISSLLRPPSRPAPMVLPRHELDPGARPLVQAILNVTPDSFFDGGRYRALDAAIARAELAVEEGADLIDVGGESTRPGAPSVTEDEECHRVLPVLDALAHRLPIPLSIDTTRSAVAVRALDAGAAIVNDVSGLARDPAMLEAVVSREGGLILMHMRGNPATMRRLSRYTSLMGEVRSVLEARILEAEAAGIPRSRLWIDPGIGFAKAGPDNLVLLRDLGVLCNLGCAVLVGASRKSFLGACLGYAIEDRLEGSLAASVAAIMNGARVVRVHEVRATRRAVDTAWALLQADLGEYPAGGEGDV